MLIGKKCKVGNMTNHDREDFIFYEGVIASDAIVMDPEDVGFLVLVNGKLIMADYYYIYDICE